MTNGAGQAFPMTGQELPHQDQGNYQPDQPYYPDPQASSMPSYASASLQAYNNGAYSEADMKPNIEAQLNGIQYANPQAQTTPVGYNSSHGHPTPQSTYPNTPQVVQTTWRNFTEGVMTNMPSGSDYAQTLMALQNPSHAAAKDATGGIHSTGNMTIAPMAGMQIPTHIDSGQPWPLIHYGGTMPNAPGQ